MSTDPREDNPAPDVPAEEAIPPIPRRPLTTYNIFSIMERHYILQHSQKTPETENEMVPPQDQTADPYFSTRPAKYRHLVLPPDWYVVGKNRIPRNKHKNHGIVSFNLLSKMISDAWGEANEETKAYCKKISSDELVRYRAEQKAFKEKYGEEAFEAQTRKRMKAENAAGGFVKENKKERKKIEEEDEKSAKGGMAAKAEFGIPKIIVCDTRTNIQDEADDLTKNQGAIFEDRCVAAFGLGLQGPSVGSLESGVPKVAARAQGTKLECEVNVNKEDPIFQDRFVQAFGLGNFQAPSARTLEIQRLDRDLLNRARDIQIIRKKLYEIQAQQQILLDQTALPETTLRRQVTPEDMSRSRMCEKSVASALLSLSSRKEEK